jgi:hypothetical protein
MKLTQASTSLTVLRVLLGISMLWLVVVAPLMLLTTVIGATVGYGAGGAGLRVPVAFDAPAPTGLAQPPIGANVLDPRASLGSAEIPLATAPLPVALPAGILLTLATLAVVPAAIRAFGITGRITTGGVDRRVVVLARQLPLLVAGGALLWSVFASAASVVTVSGLGDGSLRAVLSLAPLGWGLATALLTAVLSESLRVGLEYKEENDFTV